MEWGLKLLSRCLEAEGAETDSSALLPVDSEMPRSQRTRERGKYCPEVRVRQETVGKASESKQGISCNAETRLRATRTTGSLPGAYFRGSYVQVAQLLSSRLL